MGTKILNNMIDLFDQVIQLTGDIKDATTDFIKSVNTDKAKLAISGLNTDNTGGYVYCKRNKKYISISS